jgi:hypothetical protein
VKTTATKTKPLCMIKEIAQIRTITCYAECVPEWNRSPRKGCCYNTARNHFWWRIKYHFREFYYSLGLIG